MVARNVRVGGKEKPDSSPSLQRGRSKFFCLDRKTVYGRICRSNPMNRQVECIEKGLGMPGSGLRLGRVTTS